MALMPRKPSPALKKLAEQLFKEDGIRPLQPGERRPDGYFIFNRYTGKPLIPRGAVEKDEPT